MQSRGAISETVDTAYMYSHDERRNGYGMCLQVRHMGPMEHSISEGAAHPCRNVSHG